MATKLNGVNSSCILFLLLITACSTSKRDHFRYRSARDSKLNQEQNYKKFIVDDFKDKVFCACLLEGYKDNKLGDSIFRLMAKKDLFMLSDDMDFKRDSVTKELGRMVIKNMPPPRVHTESDITGKNFIITSCLRYFDSRELDSIANDYFNKRRREEGRL
jgi:hypothetical protein